MFKTPSFWFHAASPWPFLLHPLSALWRFGGWLRAWKASPYRASIPVICVGNIVVGGAGKTPTCLWLANELIQHGHRPVFVSRGYGGHHQTPMQVHRDHHTARDVGDEALLLARIAPTIVGRNRQQALRMAETMGTHIIMDDGMQNPHIEPHSTLLVMDQRLGIGNGRLIPSGPLRETPEQAMIRATAILIIGDPSAPPPDRIKHLAGLHHVPIFTATITANRPPDVHHHGAYVAFAGIGHPTKFYQTCRDLGLSLLATHDFADHHPYTKEDIQELKTIARRHHSRLITTDKDWVRIPPADQQDIITIPIHLTVNEPSGLLSALLHTTALLTQPSANSPTVG